MSESPFSSDFRALLAKHGITHPKFAYGAGTFDPAKPKVLYAGPMYGEDELVAATAALVEGKWSVAGEYVHRFEAEFSKYLGQAWSVMVNSGSSADLLMIAAAKARFGWKDGDGIIVSPVGFPTTISAITLNGLTPVFADIEWDTLNADNDIIEKLLQAHAVPEGEGDFNWDETELYCWPNVRAILVSPVLGNPPDMDRLVALAEKHNVKILLDGCDSLGSLWKGNHLASYATATTTSFFPSHHISTLQGGMITSNDTELVRIARQMATWGRACFCTGSANLLPNGVCGCRFKAWLPKEPDLIVDHKYVFETQGYNLQPLDLQGALGLEQMKKLDGIHEARRKAYVRIKVGALFALKQLHTAHGLFDSSPSWFGVPFICPTQAYKTALVAHLEKAGIQTRNYFAGNILLHPGYQHLGDSADFPNANDVLKKVFFLGCAPFYTEQHFAHIDATFRAFIPPVSPPVVYYGAQEDP